MKKKTTTTIPKLTAKAQRIFNNYIRQRDKDLGCISCGGRVDHAGHYFSVGAHSALRFSEQNCHGQCIGCNCYKHGNLIRYRQGLVERIGETAVRELEAEKNLVRKWSRTDLEEIIITYGKIQP
jgi:hypothetical protein